MKTRGLRRAQGTTAHALQHFLGVYQDLFFSGGNTTGSHDRGGRAGNQNQKVEDIQKGHLLGWRWEKSLGGGSRDGVHSAWSCFFFFCFLPTGSYFLFNRSLFLMVVGWREERGMEVPLSPPAQSWTDGWTGLAAKRRTATHNFLSPHILIYHTTGRLRGAHTGVPPLLLKAI